MLKNKSKIAKQCCKSLFNGQVEFAKRQDVRSEISETIANDSRLRLDSLKSLEWGNTAEKANKAVDLLGLLLKSSFKEYFAGFDFSTHPT